MMEEKKDWCSIAVESGLLTSSTILTPLPKKRHWLFKPKEDITAYELALLMPWFLNRHEYAYKDPPEQCMRHLEEVK